MLWEKNLLLLPGIEPGHTAYSLSPYLLGFPGSYNAVWSLNFQETASSKPLLGELQILHSLPSLPELVTGCCPCLMPDNQSTLSYPIP
jgi:hypothetical protein